MSEKQTCATRVNQATKNDHESLPQRSSQSRRSEGLKHVVVDATHAPRTVVSCESDDQEPRATVPTINLSLSKADRIARYCCYIILHEIKEEKMQ